jgi:hypothetical protein
MQNIIRSLTLRLLEQVPAGQLFYTPAELETFGYPGYLIKRIRLELERNLADSVSLPGSDWADMQAEPVQDAWDRFLSAIRAETRIPESFLQSVTENAIEDVLDLMAEPQRVTLETLFRSESETGLVELQTRRPWIVINGHLADALLRYMQRRQHNRITHEKAAEVIRQIDAHLYTDYTPLKWAQSLDFWFRLFNESVPATMVSRYFNDKGLDKSAIVFAQTDENLSRSRLIEYLTAAGSPDFGLHQPQEELLNEYIPVASRQIVDEDEQTEHETLSDGAYQINSLLTQEQHDESVSESNSGPDELSWYATDVIDEHSDVDSLDSDHHESNPNTSDVEFTGSETENEIVNEDDAPEPKLADIPIWQRYLGDNDSESDLDETEIEEEHQDSEPEGQPFYAAMIQPDNEKNDNALINEFPNSDDFEYIDEDSDDTEEVIYLSDDAKTLLSYLLNNRELFVQMLFNEDDASFYTELNTIAAFKDWPSAGKYITRDIFLNNDVDLYASEAIMFIDLVQQFFEEYR